MLVFYNSKIAKLATFISGFKTITLFGMCFTEKDSLTPKQLNMKLHIQNNILIVLILDCI